jgi:hypothetical protein
VSQAESRQRYGDIIQRFLAEELDGQAFEQQFSEFFVDEPPGMPAALHEVLSALYLEVEAFVADSDLLNALRTRHPNHHHIDETQLRAVAAAALARLRMLG